MPKTLGYRLARHANERGGREIIPASVITKRPSAELRPNQFDEDSLLPYPELDAILYQFVEEDRSLEEIVAAGFPEADVRRVMRLVTGAEYKRRQAAPGDQDHAAGVRQGPALPDREPVSGVLGAGQVVAGVEGDRQLHRRVRSALTR